MGDDSGLISEKEKAHLKARDRKVRGPKVVVDNPGLKKLALELAQRAREQAEKGPARGVGARKPAKP